MDFKSKGIGWVGGIYQKFETLCHEVDNIVNQETVKYVENQAQNVGKSMKRFYSDVIHDMLPPLKHGSQGVALKGSATIDTYDKSKAIEEDHIDTIDQLCTPISIDGLKGAESDIMSGQVSDLLENTSSDVNEEENAIMEETSASEVLELISPSKEESFAASSVNEFIDCNDESSCGVSSEVSLITPVHCMEFQSPLKEGTINSIAVDVVKKKLDCASSELCLVGQQCNPNSVTSIFGAEHVSSKQVAEVLKDTKPEVNTEENATMENPSASEVSELIFPSETEFFGASLLSEFNKEPCWVEAEVSPVSSAHDVQCQQKVGTVCYNGAVNPVEKHIDHALSVLCLVNQLGSTTSIDPFKEAVSDISSGPIVDNVSNTNSDMNMEENATMTKPSASEVSELISTGEQESFGASSIHESVNGNDKNPCMVRADVSPASLVHDVEFQFQQNAGTVKNDFVDDSECVSDVSGAVTSSKKTSSDMCCEENMAEVGVNSSCGLVLKEYSLPENSPENSPAKGLLYHDPVDVAGLVSHNVHSSSMLNPLLSNEKKLTGAGLISSSNDPPMESLESDASKPVIAIETLTGLLGNKNVNFGRESAQLQALSLSDIGATDDSTDDISISSMDSIELCDEVKLEDSCVIVDSTALSAIARIMRKHRSYKKRIQDALTSKTRLAKEYEQLAIWFGDADMGSNQDYLQPLRPSSSTTTSECKNLQTELLCDSEWELL